MPERKEMRNFYLVGSVLGAILPYYFFGSFVFENGPNIQLFVKQVVSARASLGFVVDLFASSFIFWPFLFKEAKRFNTPSPLWFVILNLVIGLSCALPLFLYFRERKSE
jgi:hypothetical protein